MTANRPRTVNLGRGVRVPYPEPGSEAATRIGKANRRADTKPEVELRHRLHRAGLRYRKDPLIRAGTTRTHPDLVFGPTRLAVFIDGCFWHKCPDHFHMPKSNLAYWKPKLAANVARDRRVDAALDEAGWEVLRVWEHEHPADAVHRVLTALADLGHPKAIQLIEVRGEPQRPH